MGNVFSKCKSKNQTVSEIQRVLHNSEYRTLHIEDRIYTIFDNKENVEYIEIWIKSKNLRFVRLNIIKKKLVFLII